MSRRILVIDDTPDLLSSLEEILLMEGYEVKTAKNGVEGLRLLNDFIPDLLITDMLMPEMDGSIFISEIKKIKSLNRIPIILFSASQLDKANNIKRIGADKFILKPASPEVLLKAIEESLCSPK